MGSREREHAVQRMKDYIEEHIAEPITLRMLADAANYSPWHADRVFKELTGQTPFEYLRAVRLARAAARLRDTDAKIIDVAFDFVFGSHDGFTRAFSRRFGMTPQQYRRHAPLTQFLLPGSTRGPHLTCQEGVTTMPWTGYPHTVFVHVVDRPARKIVLKQAVKATDYYEYCEEMDAELGDHAEVWRVLGGIKEALCEVIGMRMPGTPVVSQGVEVPADYAGEVPAGFEIRDFPACKMMVFQTPPYEEEEEMHPRNATLRHAMDIYDPTLYGFEWADEDGPRYGLAPMGYRGSIGARPVRQLNVKSREEMPGRSLQAGEQLSARPWRWNPYTVFVQVVDRPARKVILKRGVKATGYYEYCEEMDAELGDHEEVWRVLGSIKEALCEVVGLTMPGTSVLAQGVEVPADYAGEIPAGYDITDLPPCKMMFFHGAPYVEGHMDHANDTVRQAMATYDPTIYGFEWADEDGPRYGLAPMGHRGSIGARPVRQLNVKSQEEMPGALQPGSGQRQG